VGDVQKGGVRNMSAFYCLMFWSKDRRRVLKGYAQRHEQTFFSGSATISAKKGKSKISGSNCCELLGRVTPEVVKKLTPRS